MSKLMRLGLLLVTVLFVAPIDASSSSTWIQLSPTGGPPPPRSQHTSVYDPASNRLIIFGGCTNVPGPCNTFGRGASLNDLWVLANANGQGGTPTWIQLTPTGGPPPARFRHAAVYDSVNNRMVIWGGDSTFGSLPDLTDVWVLTNANGLDKATGLPATPNWSQLFPIGGPPTSGVSFPGREVSTAVYDSNTNRMIVFGGDACDPCTFKNDVWVLINANGLGGTPQWLQLFPTGGPPAPRTYHSAVYDAGGNRMIIFGGLAPGGVGSAVLSDTWVLANASGVDRVTGTPTTPVWTQLAVTGTLPPARGQQAAAYDAATNRMVIFGGFGVAVNLNDVWLLDNANGAGVQTPAWSQILPTGAAPAPRILFYNYNLYDGASRRMLLFGGESSGGVAFNDSWVLTEANGGGPTLTWTEKSPGANPGSRVLHAMAYDAARNQVVLFGGFYSNGFFFTDTSVWDGTTWTQKSPASSPPPRQGHSMAYDEARGEVVLFSGTVPPFTGATNDTWVWDGTTWSQKFPLTSPSARHEFAMAYDAARGVIVLFGGVTGNNAASNETWVWDGTSWTQKQPAISPQGRAGHAMAYDAIRREVVLFGGQDQMGGLNDTWVWDGTTWTQRFPAVSPPVRLRHRAAYDSARGQVLLFGGQDFRTSTIFGDTWTWDGTTWTQQFPATSPAERIGHAMAYDGGRRQVVLFSGNNSTGFLSDTWVWGLSTPAPASAPSISSISPTSGTQGQTITNFTVSGNNFQTGAILSFNPSDITVNAIPSPTVSPTQIVASITVANSAATVPHDVTVTNPDGQKATLPGAFTILAPPPPPIVPPTPVGVPGTTTNPQLTFNDPVSTGNGNYHFERTDFVIPGRGLPLVFTRSYNTRDTYAGPLGSGWTHTYNIVLAETQTGGVFIKWGDGHAESFTPSASGYVPQAGVFNTLVKNADGTFVVSRKDQTNYIFSTAGKLTSIQDKNGNAISLSYDGNANLSQVTDTVGRNLTFAYDASNRIIQIADPIGRLDRFSYSTSNELAQATDPAGGITAFAYDSSHHVTTISLPNSQILLQNSYDSSGRVVSQKNGRGFTTTFVYDSPSSAQTTITDARGNKTIHTYDASLRITAVSDALGGFTSFTYDANNDRTSVTNQTGRTTLFTYDGQGNVKNITDPLGKTVSFSYDTRNNLLTATNPKGNTTSFAYSASGNLFKIQDVLGNITSFTYDSFGALTSKIDARANTATFAYDSSGNLVRITDSLGNATNLNYDGIGRLTSLIDPKGHTASATYDALSRLIRIADPLGNQTQFVYDPVGTLLKITDAKGNATSYPYDAVNNLMGVTDALGHVTQYAYDGNNNRVTFTNAKGNATTYAFDPLNRLTRINDPLSLATSYSYDAVGNVIATTDANGKVNQFVYDALNRLIQIAYGDGKSVAYTYDSNGNRIAMTDSRGTTNYSYDRLDRLISVTQPDGKVVSYAYDALGNRSSLTYPDGRVVGYSYDALNRLAQATDWLGRATNYAYDPASNLASITYPNRAAVNFSYDPANRLTAVVNSALGVPLLKLAYTLDPVGNRTKLTVDGVPTQFGYDALNQLVSAQLGPLKSAWTYDPVGNRLKEIAPTGTTNYAYDAADRLLSAGGTAFTYDRNGNQLSKSNPRGTINYSYDAANRLVGAIGHSVNSAFVYDGDGNRVTQSTTSGTYSYVNDVATALPVVLSEQGPDGNISYAYGLGLIESLSSSFNFFYHYDGLGSVIALTDGAGKPRAAYVYDAWGNPLLSISDSVGTKNKFRFTGEGLDPGTGLYYLRARYYDPSFGRFLNRDPIAGLAFYTLSLQPYTYASNNPATLADPSGQLPTFVIGGIGGAIVGGLVSGSINAVSAAWQGKSASEVVKEAAIGIASGAASGAVTGALLGVGIPWWVSEPLAGAVGGTVSQATSNLLRGEPIGQNVGTAALTGVVSNLLVHAALPSSLTIPTGAFGIQKISTFLAGTAGAAVPVGARVGVFTLLSSGASQVLMPAAAYAQTTSFQAIAPPFRQSVGTSAAPK